MTTTVRAIGRLARAVVHVLHGMAVMTRFPRLDAAARHARIGWWAAGLLRALGVRLEVEGVARPGATLLVANHVSWLDIPAIHAAVPQARFVSKADVLDWPLLGWLIRGAGTLFIERERKRDALRVVHAMAQALREGDRVAVFPEGTTGEGPALLPFHANLLQAAIGTETPVQPAVLRYFDRGHAFSPAAAYVGGTTLARSLWRVARADGLTVRVRLLPAQASAHADRRTLAARLRAEMALALTASGAEMSGPATAMEAAQACEGWGDAPPDSGTKSGLPADAPPGTPAAAATPCSSGAATPSVATGDLPAAKPAAGPAALPADAAGLNQPAGRPCAATAADAAATAAGSPR